MSPSSGRAAVTEDMPVERQGRPPFGEERLRFGYQGQGGPGARVYPVNLGWGEAGLEALAPVSNVLVIIDVITFTTTVAVAVERGCRIYPSPWIEEEARELAARWGAALAVGRSQASAEHPYTLKPASLEQARRGESIVLPSPNGSALAALAGRSGKLVLAGSLRNAAAVARRARRLGGVISVIAAGERWGDGSLDPALEDLIGAGAILDGLRRRRRSPEAATAAAAFRHARRQGLAAVLSGCASGREQTARGHGDEIAWAAALNVSRLAPELSRGAFSA